ncbi:MAG: dipicolinate synthase subunit B [Oscillospiraceae bacterium]|jgi:dipicolinate synthase subunit B|nr:dipicolinate synthase subunit B [Oscillospiraceae bacterium]
MQTEIKDVRPTIGFAFCGSYCVFDRVIDALRETAKSYDIIPIMSENAAGTDSRFGKAEDFRNQIKEICGREPITTITGAEPIGPKKLLDLLVVAPATGNTIAKIAQGISDTSVTLAYKAHLRNARPVVIAVSSNDALSQNAPNIGTLLNRRNHFFVPYGQDDAIGKPTSLVARFELIPEVVAAALKGTQLQPLLTAGGGR